jgi:hypothetical protein
LALDRGLNHPAPPSYSSDYNNSPPIRAHSICCHPPCRKQPSVTCCRQRYRFRMKTGHVISNQQSPFRRQLFLRRSQIQATRRRERGSFGYRGRHAWYVRVRCRRSATGSRLRDENDRHDSLGQRVVSLLPIFRVTGCRAGRSLFVRSFRNRNKAFPGGRSSQQWDC